MYLLETSMDRKLKIRNSTAEFLTFTVQAQEDGIEVRLQDETIWLSQKLMGVLFECTTDNIGLHLISTSEIKISVIVDKGKADLAVHKIHNVFIK